MHGAAFANRDDITSPFVNTSRDGFQLALDISAYSLIALARGAQPLMEARGGGSILTLTFLGSARVFPNYNVMGVAKAALESSVRYLAADLGPENIRVNAISAGPVKTLAAAGIGGFSTILGVVRERRRCGARSRRAKWATRRRSCWAPAGRGVTGEVLMVDAGLSRDRHVIEVRCAEFDVRSPFEVRSSKFVRRANCGLRSRERATSPLSFQLDAVLGDAGGRSSSPCR